MLGISGASESSLPMIDLVKLGWRCWQSRLIIVFNGIMSSMERRANVGLVMAGSKLGDEKRVRGTCQCWTRLGIGLGL